ncbi:MarR family winged helix-turn-helix transcriptional regulator [Phycicoccus flavus]|uniref:MarR family winged helix-turn-helix transcriptional regulator n=1 Tax=Phycicoccus flavus TaxID=2502783 RepID=UPI000FEB781C|nr:MarR family transcriptional regulator [Phycicoccus flavus]NHA69797.1 MarR family transcriptional regulator [Phycicoccus flavus]
MEHGASGGRNAAGGIDPETLTGWTLVRTGRAMGDRFLRLFADHGVTKHQFGVLVRLSREPGVSQAALAREILVTPQSVGPILREMERVGLLRRIEPGTPGRAVAVEITPAGRRTLAVVGPAVAELNRPESLGLTADEARDLGRLLHRVHDHLSG